MFDIAVEGGIRRDRCRPARRELRRRAFDRIAAHPTIRPGRAFVRFVSLIFAGFLTLSLAGSVHARDFLYISEFTAANGSGIVDEDGDSSDWCEIYNAGPNIANLSGWHLTDDPGNLIKWTLPTIYLQPGQYLVVFLSGKDRSSAGFAALHANFSLDVDGEFLALVEPDGQTIAHAYSPEFPQQIIDVSYGVTVGITTNNFITNNAQVKWRIPMAASDMPPEWAATNYDDTAWTTGVVGLGFDQGGELTSAIQTDIGGAMMNVNATALVRMTFSIIEDELPVVEALRLRVRYDDGFIAYLNGVEIARRNVPAGPDWTSSATDANPDIVALQFEDIDVTSFQSLLQEGNNVLAIHGLNVSVADDDFLIAAELAGYSGTPSAPQYYAVPTPGSGNFASYLGIVADTKFSVDRGFFDVPFQVGITSATEDAEIRFTTNGSAPTAVSGAVYTGPITIDRTTVLRAMAVKPGYKSTDVDTHTYVFLSNILTQNLQQVVSAGYPANWSTFAADYDMDPSVVTPNAAAVASALRALPSVFISTSVSNLFDPNVGIYTFPTAKGLFWERASAMEMVGTNGQTEFEVGCGLRIQGAFFRNHSATGKHSFRVLFKSEYGAGKLQHDIFKQPGAVEEFDTLVLRANGNDGYSWNNMLDRPQFIRDEFGRRLLLDMGHPQAHGIFVHLYLNGIYWGVYNLVERPNEDFSASYMGGEPEDWDSITSGGLVKSGDTAAWNVMMGTINPGPMTYARYFQIQGRNPDGTPNPAYTNLWDKVNYLDYMIVNMWGGNHDWGNNNFWMGRKRTADSTGFKFYAWDYEDTMHSTRSPLEKVAPRVDGSNERSWVLAPHYYMKAFIEYQRDFADRVQKHFFNGGLLTPQVLTNRYKALSDEILPVVVAESARWGDDNHLPPYGLSEWINERNYLLNTYMRFRSGIVLQQFGASNLFPTLVGPPMFNQYGGAVPAGFSLVITHTNGGAGLTFYTTNGVDPRAIGSTTLSPSARSYSGPIPINAPTMIRARTFRSGQWSGIVDAMFFPPQDLSALVITELMYNPPNFGATNGDEVEFLELKNVGTNLLNLSGLTFTAGITFTFTNGTLLEPGQFFVLARNPAAMAAKYPGVLVRGIYTGRLDNGGEALTLSHALGPPIFTLNYNDRHPWPLTGDGAGYSIVPRIPGLSQAPDDGLKWRSSAVAGGSPGADDPPPDIPPIVINEILAHTDLPQVDSIELFNPGVVDVDISGWFLTDDGQVPKKYRFPDSTVISAGGYIYVTEAEFNPTPGTTNNFGLSSLGDDVYLFSATTNGVLTGYNYGVEFGASYNGVSFGRHVDSTGADHFPWQISESLGVANSGPRIAPVVINEIHYNAPTNTGDEFIELLNISESVVALFDTAFPTNAWKIGGAGFTFPTNVFLDPNSSVLIVSTNPSAFRAKFGIPPAIQIFGPIGGNLQDSGELLELQAPDSPQTNGVVPYVTIDAVRYNDREPWPPAADGTGLSLQRIVPASFGNDPINWAAAGITPGQFYSAADTDGDTLTDVWETANGTDPYLADANDDLDLDGLTNLQEYYAGTSPSNPESCLRFFALAGDADGISFQFTAMSNRTYSVLGAPALEPPGWMKIADYPAFSTNRVETVFDVPSSEQRFYRVVTPAEP